MAAVFGYRAAVAGRQAVEQGRLAVEQGRLTLAEARTARREERRYQELARLERLMGLVKRMWAIVNRLAESKDSATSGYWSAALLYDLRAKTAGPVTRLSVRNPDRAASPVAGVAWAGTSPALAAVQSFANETHRRWRWGLW